MNNVTICLKQYLNEEDCRKIEELKNACTFKEDIFLKLELDFKLNMHRVHGDEPFQYANEFLYYSGEMLIGYLGIFSFGGDKGELTGMVHPDFRRRGIFKRLHSLALEECRRRGFNEILLVCDRESSSGLSFIQSTKALYSFSEYEMRLCDNRVSEAEKDIVLRKSTNLDAEEIARLNNICFGDTSGTLIMPEEEQKRNRITYMIEQDLKTIGKIRVDISPEEGYISGFAIFPEYRGKGYGKQALKGALCILNKSGSHNVTLEVAVQNKNALNLYKSCGFVEESVMDYYEVK